MIQIDWSKAPAWAQWWAMDAGTSCYFYEDEPNISKNYNWWICSYGKIKRDFNSETYNLSGIDWRETLTRRPSYSEKPNTHSGNRSEKPNS